MNHLYLFQVALVCWSTLLHHLGVLPSDMTAYGLTPVVYAPALVNQRSPSRSYISKDFYTA